MKDSRTKILLLFFIFLLVVGSAILYLCFGDIAVLNPKGIIGEKQRALIITSTLLMLIVVFPVFLLTFWITWRYRHENKKAHYAPHWWHSTAAELVWWGVPCILIVILGIMTYRGSHELDPFKPLAEESQPPLKIQVISLQWKWLFLYPDHGIATLNYIKFPEQTPLNFSITSDAPMNGFWIPELGGQVYAMSGMQSKLHLMANGPGIFRGSSSNLSGSGFAGMVFSAEATTHSEFEKWVQSIRQASPALDIKRYTELQAPSQYIPPASFVLKRNDLFDWVLMKYMEPTDHHD